MKISVYITSYNQKNYLIEAIESVLAQTLQPHQIIIVDDASQDGSQEVIATYKDRCPHLITPIYHERNLGVSLTRIDALNAVTGNYVTYVDGDDRFLPTKLEKEAACLQAIPQARIAYSNYYVIDAKGERIDVWAPIRPLPQGFIFNQTFGRDFPKRRIFRDELVHYPSWKELGFYDPTLRVFEDYEMRIRLTKHLKVAYTGEILIEHRRLATGLSNLNAQLYLDTFKYICKKNLPLIKDLSQKEQEYIHRKLNEWHAALIRRIGRETLVGTLENPPSRFRAMQYYWQSQNYHRYLDTHFILEWILSPKVYNFGKTMLHELRKSLPGY